MSTTVSVKEAQGKLAQLLELAQAGHEVIIQDPQKGRARLLPLTVPATPATRRFGLHEGEVYRRREVNSAKTAKCVGFGAKLMIQKGVSV